MSARPPDTSFSSSTVPNSEPSPGVGAGWTFDVAPGALSSASATESSTWPDTGPNLDGRSPPAGLPPPDEPHPSNTAEAAAATAKHSRATPRRSDTVHFLPYIRFAAAIALLGVCGGQASRAAWRAGQPGLSATTRPRTDGGETARKPLKGGVDDRAEVADWLDVLLGVHQ